MFHLLTVQGLTVCPEDCEYLKMVSLLGAKILSVEPVVYLLPT